MKKILFLAALLISAAKPSAGLAQVPVFSETVTLKNTDSTAQAYDAYEYQIWHNGDKIYLLSLSDSLYQRIKRANNYEVRVQGLLLNENRADQLLENYQDKLETEKMPAVREKELVNSYREFLTIREGENCFLIMFAEEP